MNPQISCEAAVEPRGQITSDGHVPVGIQLNFEILDDVGPGPAAKQAAAKSFEDFLGHLKNVDFALYYWSGTTITLVDAAGRGFLMPIDAPPAGAPGGILKWLEACVRSDLALWGAKPPVDGEIGGYRLLTAGHLLAGAENWAAPLPQDAGLTRLVEAKLDLDAHTYVILPYLKGSVPVPACDVIRDAAGNSIVPDFDFGGFPVDHRISPVEGLTIIAGFQDGFVDIDEQGPEFFRRLARLREKSGATFWSAPHVAAMSLGPHLGSNHGLGGVDKQATDAALHQICDRALALFGSAFDSLFLGISMGGGDREGPLIAALLAEAESVAPDEPVSRQARESFVAELRAALQNLRPDAGGSPKWAPFIEQAANWLGHGEEAYLAPPPPPEQLAAKLASAEPLLPLLLALALQPGVVLAESAKIDFAALEARLDREAQDLIERLANEESFGAVLVAFFRSPDPFSALVRLFGSIDGQSPEGAAAAADAACIALAKRFGGQWHPLAAAQRAIGMRHAELLIGTFNAKAMPTWEDVEVALYKTAWFKLRFALVALADQALKPLLDFIPVLPTPRTEAEFLTEALGAAWEEVCDDLEAIALPRSRRFSPDIEPRNLPVRIPLPPTVGEDDPFEAQYDGFGLLIAKLDKMDQAEEDAHWIHANLACLDTGEGPPSERTLLPLRPAVLGGEREVQFDYCGLPYAFDAEETGHDGGDDDFRFAPPYYSPQILHGRGKEEKLPGLAYGQSYRYAAFAISRNGVLPEWIAKGTSGRELFTLAEIPKVPAGASATFHYARTTGIGRASIVRETKDAFKTSLAAIQPLAKDYPRLGLTATAKGRSWADLWRGRNGLGTIPLAVGAVINLRIADLVAAGSGTVSIHLISDPTLVDLNEKPPFTFKVDLAETSLALSLERTDETRLLCTLTHQDSGRIEKAEILSAPAEAWVRVELAADEAGASLSFADPAGALEGRAGGGDLSAKNYLLLRPDENIWRSEYPAALKASIELPSMSFADLDRWLLNPELFKDAGGEHKKGDKDPIRRVVRMMHDVEGRRDEDTIKFMKGYAGVFPDLAVGEVIAELVFLDAIGKTLDPTEQPPPCRIPIPTFAKLLANVPATDPLDVREVLPLIAQQRALRLHVASGAAKLVCEDGTLSVGVPPGITAQLVLRSAVKCAHFEAEPPVITPEIRQFATGQSGSGETTVELFDGAPLTIEVMAKPSADHAELIDLTSRSLSVEPIASSRRYELRFDPANHKSWQIFGTADITSQRWRHLGRPIHNWFRPRDFAYPIKAGEKLPHSPIIRLERHEDILAFEGEAFDRSDLDAETHTVVLAPARAISRLHEGVWEPASATLFRHRLDLRSRYAGALSESARVTTHWSVVGGDENPPREDWVRVAVLAAQDRLTLTRPQLRSLLPLNRSPGDAATPPLLAMLSEPPFAHGGLADRVAAGVATGFGYELKGGHTDKLEIADARQEAGPDPVLTYRPLDRDLSLSLSFLAEGPIGFTHDRAAGTSAAFANSAWTLALDPLSGSGIVDLQEHFVSVSMRRYLDPHWLTLPDKLAVDCQALAFKETRWIEATHELEFACGVDVLTAKREGRRWTVAAGENAILPDSEAGKSIPILSFDDIAETGIALLHQPLDAARAALSVFALRADGSARLMASFEWIAPTTPAEGITIAGAGVVSFTTSSSMATSTEWGRIARNADMLLAQSSAHPLAKPIAVSGLALQVEDEKSLFVNGAGTSLWLRPSHHDAPNPLHNQRCLALLPTEAAGGKERAAESYTESKRAAALLIEKSAPLVGPTAETRARIIEFEMNAKPLTSEPYALPEFKKVSFEPAEFWKREPAALLFLIQPSGPGRLLNKGMLSFVVEALGQKFTVELSFDEGKRPEMLVLAAGAGEASSSVGWSINADGKPASIEIKNPEAGEPAKINMSVELSEAAAGSAWWGNVSMLSLGGLPQSVGDIPLDFEWFFGEHIESRTDKFSHDALRDLKAAEARVISVSPPIALR